MGGVIFYILLVHPFSHALFYLSLLRLNLVEGKKIIRKYGVPPSYLGGTLHKTNPMGRQLVPVSKLFRVLRSARRIKSSFGATCRSASTTLPHKQIQKRVTIFGNRSNKNTFGKERETITKSVRKKQRQNMGSYNSARP